MVIDSMIFSVIIPKSYKDIYVNSFFPSRARNSIPGECFSLIYDLNSFNSSAN